MCAVMQQQKNRRFGMPWMPSTDFVLTRDVTLTSVSRFLRTSHLRYSQYSLMAMNPITLTLISFSMLTAAKVLSGYKHSHQRCNDLQMRNLIN